MESAAGYSTWMWGTEACLFYDREIFKMLSDGMFFWRLSYQYLSNWRNLHVDGFEGYIWNRAELPKPQGYRIRLAVSKKVTRWNGE
jgi:hypothetical protein